MSSVFVGIGAHATALLVLKSGSKWPMSFLGFAAAGVASPLLAVPLLRVGGDGAVVAFQRSGGSRAPS